MAKNWIDAQKNEKIFWKNIYINNIQDDIYTQTNKYGWINFTRHVLDRNHLNLKFLNGKKILDLGSGPGGVAKGIHELIKNFEIKNSKIIAVDPLMDFYKNEIGLLIEDDFLSLLSNKGEKLEISDNSIDIVFSTNVLDHCDNPAKIVDEVYRVLKPGGKFYPSLHLVYSYLSLFTPYIKYFDTNHPYHLTLSMVEKLFVKKFVKVKVLNKYPISHDQKNFTFLNIFKGNSRIRSLKRFLSKFVLFTCYFECEK